MHSDNEERHNTSNVRIYPTGVPDIQSTEAPRASRTRSDKSKGSTRNVLEAANERLKLIFNDFDNVLVAFSCGKDSGVMLNLTYNYAKENNLLHKLSFYYEDYEADYKYTHEYAERTFKGLVGVKSAHWLCLPISAACSVSMHQNRWIPWDQDKKEIWVRPMPEGDYVVNEFNCPYEFIKGTKGFDARIQYSTWFGKTHGSTAVLIGIRVDESLSRRAIITSNNRTEMHKGIKYSKTVDKNTCNFYPIYDWHVDDIWIANAKLNFDYNKIYDLYYQAGLNIAQMRVASPFHASGQENLKLYKVIDPNTWGKMVGRVNGVNFTGIYGGTTAMGWRSISKPDHFTWEEYAQFLLSTLPDETKKKYIEKIEKSKWHWRVQGGARSPEFIKQLEIEGWKVRRTHKMANRGHRKDELIYIDEMRDDTNVPEFKRAPSWKRVCVAIMKNDTSCLSMGFQRTADQNILRQKALEKYNKKQQDKK